MSAAPSVPPFFDDAADVVILSGKMQHIHLVPKAGAASSESSPWVESGYRRGFDFALAAIAMILASPMMALTALLVRVSSPGPVLFRQHRAGRGRTPFTLYKFRSMRINPEPGSPLTVDGDPRITPLGAFLRRYKLDELPQLWNVLKGDLSLVGPRPKLPHLEALDLPYRPGVTGMATLAFRNEESILSEVCEHHVDAFYENCIKPRKAQLDRQYMRRATLWSDLSLLWRTASSCVLRSDSLSAQETETLQSLAAAWPATPPQSSEDRASEFDASANYFARVELHGAQWPDDYRKLDRTLEKHGFSNFIQGYESAHPLPMALYFAVNRLDDLHAVARTVKYCADRTGFNNNVLVIKSAGSRFYFSGAQETSEEAA
jgi:lipopolysaccharide/colanic/teichoic acid biosynthesis glycosyltransferase